MISPWSQPSAYAQLPTGGRLRGLSHHEPGTSLEAVETQNVSLIYIFQTWLEGA